MIDVSWAVVQRSHGWELGDKSCLWIADVNTGFLDGGDRSTALPLSAMPPPPADKENPQEDIPAANPPNGHKSFVVSIAVTSTLLIKNLPLLLFSRPSELEPLLLPFGHIKKLDILETFGSDTTTGFVTIAVEYATADSAYEAKMTLDGQVYVNNVLNIEFVQPVPPACDVLVHQASQFPLTDGSLALQAPRRSPLITTRHGYNSRSAGTNTPTNGLITVGMNALGPASSSAPATPYPFSAASGMSPYLASNAPLLDGRLDDVRPLNRFAEV